jgi:hypothetical protein
VSGDRQHARERLIHTLLAGATICRPWPRTHSNAVAAQYCRVISSVPHALPLLRHGRWTAAAALWLWQGDAIPIVSLSSRGNIVYENLHDACRGVHR